MDLKDARCERAQVQDFERLCFFALTLCATPDDFSSFISSLALGISTVLVERTEVRYPG